MFISKKYNLNTLSEKKLKSISVFIPEEVVNASLEKIGFIQTESATTSSDGKFWKKTLYVKGDEMISVSEELGDYWPKDPIISICGLPTTIKTFLGDLNDIV
jgi:hypothetical protein